MECKTNKSEVRMGGGGSTKRVGLFTKEFANRTLSLFLKARTTSSSLQGIHKGSLTEVEQILVIVNLALTMPKLQRQPSPKSLKFPPKNTITTTTTIIILHHHPIPIVYNNNNNNNR
jgi:hypothetical protein